MSQELIFVFGVILTVGILGYMLLEPSGKLSASEIAGYAQAAGFMGDDIVTATAIALAESSGNPNAQGDFIGGNPTSFGLWQIHWTVHRESYQVSPSELFDPQTNANAAYKIFLVEGWGAWSTYGNLPGHNNAYAKYVPGVIEELSA